jgi:hypothetical protein
MHNRIFYKSGGEVALLVERNARFLALSGFRGRRVEREGGAYSISVKN